VAQTLEQIAGPVSEWVFDGTRETALAVAKSMGVDAVVMPELRAYRQGNLIDSEVEIELALLDAFSATTVWSVRENVRGASGNSNLGQPVRAPGADRLAVVALEKAVATVEGISRKGEDFRVRTMTPKKAAGYSLLGVGVASLGVTGYFAYEAAAAYRDYKDATRAGEINDLKEKTQRFDTLALVFGGLSAAALGTGIYLLVTDEPIHSMASDTGQEGWRRLNVLPAYDPMTGSARLLLQIRF
jgi:hypothetical protein